MGGVLHPKVALGGPVQPDAGVAVAQLRSDAASAPPDGVRVLTSEWAVIDLDGDPDQLADQLADAQLFVGYSGWSPGQLDGELAAGSWWVVDSAPGDLQLARRARGTTAGRRCCGANPTTCAWPAPSSGSGAQLIDAHHSRPAEHRGAAW